MSIQTMESMVKWVDDNVMHNPSLENMSSYVGYSPYYCSSKFREHTGVTYKQYLAKQKLLYAAKLLISTEDKIVDVALRCSYASPEALTRAFTKAYQCTPTQYRERYKQSTS